MNKTFLRAPEIVRKWLQSFGGFNPDIPTDYQPYPMAPSDSTPRLTPRLREVSKGHQPHLCHMIYLEEELELKSLYSAIGDFFMISRLLKDMVFK